MASKDWRIIGGTNLGSGGGGGGDGTGSDAPNITSATLSISYEPWASVQKAFVSGTIHLPADLTHLIRIDIVGYNEADPAKNLTVCTSVWDLSGTSVTYKGEVEVQPPADQTWTFQFICYDADNRPADSPYELTGILIEGAAVIGVTGEEVGPRYQDALMGMHTQIKITPTFANPEIPCNVTLWVNTADGRGWGRGVWLFDLDHPDLTLGAGDQNHPGDVWVPTNPDHSLWTVAAAAGNVETSEPSGAYVTGTFTVAAVGIPSDTDITNAHFIPNPVSGELIQYIRHDPGTYLWGWYALEWTQPELATDDSYWYSYLTTIKGYEDEAGVWHNAPDYEGKDDDPELFLGRKVTDSGAIQGGTSLLGSTVECLGDYPPDWTFPQPKNLDGSTNLYRTFRFRIYAVSRRGSDEAGGDPSSIVLQKCWPGGADHFDLTPSTQPHALDLSQTNPRTSFHPDSPLTGGDGVPISIALAIPLTTLDKQIALAVKGISSEYIADTAIQAKHMAAASITAANGALAANSVVDNNIGGVGVNKLIAGTQIFTGDVYLSRGSSKPVIALTNAGMDLFGVASGAGNTGLTSQPFVHIDNNGVGVFATSTGASVITNGTGITLYSVNGNTTQPYVAVTGAGGIQLVHGAFTSTVEAARIRMAYSSGVSATLDSSGIKIIDGTYSLVLQSDKIQLWSADGNPAAPYVGIDAGHVYIGQGSNLVTLSSTSVRMDHGSQYVLLKSTGEVEFHNSLGTMTYITGGVIVTDQLVASQTLAVAGPATIGAVGGSHALELLQTTYGTFGRTGPVMFAPLLVNGTTYYLPLYS